MFNSPSGQNVCSQFGKGALITGNDLMYEVQRKFVMSCRNGCVGGKYAFGLYHLLQLRPDFVLHFLVGHIPSLFGKLIGKFQRQTAPHAPRSCESA